MNLNSVLKPILEEEGGTTDTLYKKKQLQKQEWNKFYDTMDIVNVLLFNLLLGYSNLFNNES